MKELAEPFAGSGEYLVTAEGLLTDGSRVVFYNQPVFCLGRSTFRFSRSFDVSGINVDGITASFQDGVLKLDMPKKVETVPPVRKLEIK